MYPPVLVITALFGLQNVEYGHIFDQTLSGNSKNLNNLNQDCGFGENMKITRIEDCMSYNVLGTLFVQLLLSSHLLVREARRDECQEKRNGRDDRTRWDVRGCKVAVDCEMEGKKWSPCLALVKEKRGNKTIPDSFCICSFFCLQNILHYSPRVILVHQLDVHRSEPSPSTIKSRLTQWSSSFIRTGGWIHSNLDVSLLLILRDLLMVTQQSSQSQEMCDQKSGKQGHRCTWTSSHG